jgi:hypothetical protein
MTYSRTIAALVLWAIAQPVALVLLSSPSSAQWWQRQQPQQGYDPQPTAVRHPNITRDQQAQLLQLGGSLDADGFFSIPIPLTAVGLRADIPDGWVRRPMEWEPENSILLRIEGGYIIQQDFQLNP